MFEELNVFLWKGFGGANSFSPERRLNERRQVTSSVILKNLIIRARDSSVIREHFSEVTSGPWPK